jgi:peptidoglycan/LPS O-acetylase OafA/YrhL
VKLGAWSYSIYLIHWLIYVKCSQGHQNEVSWAIAAFAGAVASGAILNYLIEAPIERFRHSLQFRIRVKTLRLPHL